MRTGDALRQVGAGAVLDDPSLMALYSHDQARLPKLFRRMIAEPAAVVQPTNGKETQRALRWCRDNEMAAVPRGAGSNAFGGSLSLDAYVAIDTRRMDDIEVLPDTTAWVGGGATWNRVMFHLEKEGLKPRVHTTSQFSTVAGMAATGGMGLGSTRWGSLQDNVVEVEIAVPGGVHVVPIEQASTVFRTDGQMGIITRLRIKTRPAAKQNATIVRQVNDYAQAVELARQVSQLKGVQTVLVYDKARVHEVNAVVGRDVVPERDTIVARFEGAIPELDSNVPPEAVGVLWEQRHFPMRPLKMGPGLLGAELLLPDGVVGKYVAMAKRRLRAFGLNPANEAYVLPGGQVLNITTFLTDAAAKAYTMHVAQVAHLTRKAIKMGGTVYGGGLWNMAFSKNRHDNLSKLREYKQKLDPENVLNPGKSLAPPRRTSVAGVFLRTPLGTWGPTMSRAIAKAARYEPREIQPAATDVAHPGSNHPDNIHAHHTQPGTMDAHNYSHEACTQCAACVPVCPAWQHTGDDRTTARGKLQFMARMATGADVSADQAAALYQCIRCRACEDVCQTDLPLLSAFDALEVKLTKKFGFPTQTVTTFLEGVEADEKAQTIIDETRGIFGEHALLAEAKHG